MGSGARLAVFALVLFSFLATGRAPVAESVEQPVLGDNGLYHHSWFLDSFLDLKDDLTSSSEEGKRLVVMFEQKGCIYCRKIQTEILTDPKINAYVRKHFDIVQLDLWGDREVTDFDGEAMPEKSLARKWRVMFTPTIVFFPDNAAAVEEKSGIDVAVASMPGAFGKLTFLALFEWVKEKGYESGEHFQKYVIRKMEESGTMQPTN